MFDLSQLRCFTTLAAELNFRRAAERLHMTQPPLSRQIQLLEHQLGVSLFTRSTRSVALTAAGRAFFVEAQALLDQAHRAAQSARLAAIGESGSLNISFVAHQQSWNPFRYLSHQQRIFSSPAINSNRLIFRHKDNPR